MTQFTDDPRLRNAIRKSSGARSPDLDPRIARSVGRSNESRIVNPFGDFKATSTFRASFATNFKNSFARSVAPFVAPLGEVGATFAERAEFGRPPGTGAGGFFGGVAGSVMPSVFMVMSPTISPVIAAQYAGVASAEDWRENQNVLSSIGAGVFEATAEMVGAKLIRTIGIRTSQSLGRAIAQGNTSQITKIIGAEFLDMGIEGFEEELTLMANLSKDVALGIKTPEQALKVLQDQGLMVFASGAVGGAFLGAFSFVSQASIREFKQSLISQRTLRESISTLSPEAKEAIGKAIGDIQAEHESFESGDTESRLGRKLTEQELEESKFVKKALESESSKGIGSDDSTDAVERFLSDDEISAREKAEALILEQGDDQPRADQPSKEQSVAPDQRESASRETTDKRQAETIMESEELRAQLRDERRFARQAVAQVKRRERSKARQQLADLRQKAQEKESDIRELNSDIRRFVRESPLPKSEKDKLLASAASNVRTKKAFASFADKILKAEIAFERTQAQKDLKSALRDAKRAKDVPPNIREALDSITEGVDPSNLREKTRVRLQGLADFLESNPNAVIPQRHIDRLRRLDKKPAASMSAQEANDITDAINAILRENELKQKLVASLKTRDKSRVANAIKKELRRNLKKRARDERGRLSPKTEDTVLRLIYGLEEGSSIDTIAEFISGGDGTVTHQVLVDDVNLARELALERFYEVSDAWEEGLQGLGIEMGGTQLETMSDVLKQHRGVVKKLFGQKDVDTEVREISLSRGQNIKIDPSRLMMLNALLKDKQTLDLVVFGGTPLVQSNMPDDSTFTLSNEDVQVLDSAMTLQERQIVDLFVQIMNDQVSNTYIEYTMSQFGVDRTQDGRWVSRRRRVTTREGAVPEAITARTMHQRAAENVGIDKDRTSDTQLPIEVPDLFAEFTNVVWTVSHLRHTAPALRAANEILADPGIRSIINDSKHSRALKSFRTTYDAVAAEVVGKSVMPSLVHKPFRKLVNKTSVALLGINVPVMFYQGVSLMHAHEEIPLRYVGRAFSEMSRGRSTRSQIIDRMHRNGTMRFRNEGSVFGKINEGGGGGARILGFGPKDNVAMRGIAYIDQQTVATIWRASELQAMDELQKTDPLDDLVFQRASEIATRTVRRTQPTSDAMSLSGVALARRESDLAALLFMFRAQLSKSVDMTHRNIIRARRDPAFRPQAIANISVIWIASSFAIELIREFYRSLVRGFNPDPREERNVFTRVITNTLFRMMSVPLFVGTVANAARGWFGSDFSAVESVLIDTVKDTRRAVLATAKGERVGKILDPTIDAAAGFIGLFYGKPVISPVREIKRVMRAMEEDDRRNNKRRSTAFGA